MFSVIHSDAKQVNLNAGKLKKSQIYERIAIGSGRGRGSGGKWRKPVVFLLSRIRVGESLRVDKVRLVGLD